MEPITFHIKTHEIRANCLGLISQIEADAGIAVKVFSENESRSAAQSRLRWVWFGFMAKKLAGIGKGRSKDEWNMYYKHKYMKDLLIEQDEDFVPFFQDYEDTCERLKGTPLLAKYQSQFWAEIAKTEHMNTKTFSVWLGLISDDALDRFNLVLPIPEDLKWLQD